LTIVPLLPLRKFLRREAEDKRYQGEVLKEKRLRDHEKELA